jgi:hypothetical protein
MVKRRVRGARNPVREAVEKVGGIIEACAILKVSNRTLARWLAAGHVPQLDAALRLAQASGMPVQRFARQEPRS